MTTVAQSITRMRRFLRDPDGLIWSGADLLAYWNEAQQEVAQKTGILERIEAHYYPPMYDWSYMYDWELAYIKGDTIQCFSFDTRTGDSFMYPWEAAYSRENINAPDDGARFMHPWEALYVSPAGPLPFKLHSRFDQAKYVAFDKEPIQPITENELALYDRYYQTATGEPTHYWRRDEFSNIAYLYPQPAAVWQVPSVANTFDDAGGIIVGDAQWLDTGDLGLITDVISVDNALFMVYQAIPFDVGTASEESEFPAWLVKYVEYAVLERAFGADTDGFIPSLRDYWKSRKEIGIQAIKRFMRMRTQDRDYRLGGLRPTARGRHPRLPSTYPDFY